MTTFKSDDGRELREEDVRLFSAHIHRGGATDEQKETIAQLRRVVIAYGGPGNVAPCRPDYCDALPDSWCSLNCVAKALVEGRPVSDGPPRRVTLEPES